MLFALPDSRRLRCSTLSFPGQGGRQVCGYAVPGRVLPRPEFPSEVGAQAARPDPSTGSGSATRPAVAQCGQGFSPVRRLFPCRSHPPTGRAVSHSPQNTEALRILGMSQGDDGLQPCPFPSFCTLCFCLVLCAWGGPPASRRVGGKCRKPISPVGATSLFEHPPVPLFVLRACPVGTRRMLEPGMTQLRTGLTAPPSGVQLT